MSKTELQVACLSVGLVSAWAPVANADILTEVRFQSSLTLDVSHVTMMLGGSGSGGLGGVMLTNLTIPGSGSGAFSSALPTSEFGFAFAMIGLGSGSGGNIDLVVSMGGLTYVGGDLFEDTFPGYTESSVIQSLLQGTPLAQDFLSSQFSRVQNGDGLYSPAAAFSGATSAGSLRIDVVSVPAPSAIIALPFLCLGGRRRR